MVFNSYTEFMETLSTIGFQDIILGVKDTITANTVYITLAGSKKTGADGFSWVIGYTYNVVASVTDVDSHLIQELSELLAGGLEYVDYSDSSHLYSFSGSVYLPCGSKGQAWE